MKNDRIWRFFCLILALVLIPWAGCSTTQGIYNKVMPEKNARLKKRVLVLPLMDQAGLGEAKVGQIASQLLTLLDQKAHLLLVRPTNPMPRSSKITSPGFGIVIDPDQARRAEEMGMNVLMTVVLSPFEVHTKRTGIWPFRKFRRELEISMVVNALDVTNGTLFLTHLESRRIRLPSLDELEDEDFEQDLEKRLETRFSNLFDPSEIDRKKFDKAWSRIVEDQASAIKRALNEQPWSGKILSADSETIIVNAGKDIGLTEGDVFEVYGQGESILSVSGRSLYLMGPKVGEIKTVKVMDRHASAVPLETGHFFPGQIIREKGE
ncbi:MAG: hypothetical protein PVG99_11655 [Desulfobacteraceae bacterium]|jgi:hypothetical protein